MLLLLLLLPRVGCLRHMAATAEAALLLPA
jgi:hypothetical protein